MGLPACVNRALAGMLMALGMRLMMMSMPPFMPGRRRWSGCGMGAYARKLRVGGNSLLVSASSEIEPILAGMVSSGSESTRTRTSLLAEMRPRSISSTLASISRVLRSGISASPMPAKTLSPTLNGLAFIQPCE